MSYDLSESDPVRVAPPEQGKAGGGNDPIMGDILAAVGGKVAKDEYLASLRCPKGRGITWTRHGSNMGRHMKPVDKYTIQCKCGRHSAVIYVDAYSSGPRQPIGISGWTLADGPEDASSAAPSATETASTCTTKKWWQFWK